MDRPAIQVAVLIEREAQPNRWEDWRFRIAEVVQDDGGFGESRQVLRQDGHWQRTLHPGFTLEQIGRAHV